MKCALISLIVVLAACGGPEGRRTLVDETRDLIISEPTSNHLAGTRPAGPELVGTQWSWREAHCTEGEATLPPTFARTTRIQSAEAGLLFMHDDQLAEGCDATIVQSATPGSEADAIWSMSEQAVIVVGPCETLAEADRPGDVRMRAQNLEVYVQRSVWCNGLELRMAYVPAEPVVPGDIELARHYAAHFNRQDARRITELFAPTGSLVDPFTRTSFDQAVRYDGQAAVFEWFVEAFGATPWLALRIISIEATGPGSVMMDWHYMDPRLDGPFAGRNRFTVATGQIFETSVEITAQEVPEELVTPAAPAPATPATPATPNVDAAEQSSGTNG